MPNTAEQVIGLPLATEQRDMCEQWLRRLLKNPLFSSPVPLEPWVRQALAEANWNR